MFVQDQPVFVKCSGAASPPSCQLLNTATGQSSSPSQSHTETSDQPQAGTRVSVPAVRASYQMPAVSPLVPRGQFQHPSTLNPVFVDSRPPAVRPTTISPPTAVVAMPLIAPAVFPQSQLHS